MTTGLHERWAASSDSNDRAVALVIRSIAKYPQVWHGALLVADGLFCEIDEVACARPYVTLADMANVEPDPVPTAAAINAVHDAFGIRKRVRPNMAERFVRRCGYVGLECIRLATVFHAQDQEIATPRVLQQEIYIGGTFHCPEEVYSSAGVPDLDRFLRTEEEVRVWAASDIMEYAEEIRADSTLQQTYAVHLQGERYCPR